MRAITTFGRSVVAGWVVAGWLAAATAAAGTTPILIRQPSRAVLRIHVSTAGIGSVADAAVVVLQDRASAAPTIRTTADGVALFTLPVRETPQRYAVAVRKLGYAPIDRQIEMRSGDTVRVEIALVAVNALDTVRVQESALPVAKRPFVGAEEIAHNKRFALSLTDVINTLRPDIGYQLHRCLPLPRSGPASPGPIPRSAQGRSNLPFRFYINGEYVPSEWDPGHLIRAEDIQEIRYVNCFDRSGDRPESPWATVYVVLKPGVQWDLKHASRPAKGRPN